MMHGVPFVFFGAPLQERKIGHPEKIEFVRDVVAVSLLNFCDAQPDAAEHFAGDLPFVRRRRKCRSPSSICNLVAQRFLLRLGKEFHDRRFPFAVLDLDEGESFRAERFRDRGQFVDLADGDAGEILSR